MTRVLFEVNPYKVKIFKQVYFDRIIRSTYRKHACKYNWQNSSFKVSSIGSSLKNSISSFSLLNCLLGSNRSYQSASKEELPKGPSSTPSPASKFSSFYKPMVVFVVTAVGLLAYFKYEKSKMEEKKLNIIKKSKGHIGEAKIGGPFSLVNQFNQRVTDKDFLGKFCLYYFGFTHCPDICPEELEKMAKIINLLSESSKTRDKLVPLFVTVDPKRDGPKELEIYLNEFHPQIIGLTGTSDEVLHIAKSFRVYCSKNVATDTSSDYIVDHSVFFYLMGPDGKFVDYFGNEASAEEIVSSISEYIRQANTSGKLPLTSTSSL